MIQCLLGEPSGDVVERHLIAEYNDNSERGQDCDPIT